MTSKREDILAHIETILASTAGVTGKVYRSRPEAISRAESPVLLVEGMETTADLERVGLMDWWVMFRVGIITRGAVPDSAADPILNSAYAILMADRTLGARAIDLSPVKFSFKVVDGDNNIGITDCIFKVKHRTSATDLTA